jgi:hypothetical protein
MTDGANAPGPASSEVPDASKGAYKSAQEALDAVAKAFNDFSGSVTSTSLQMCYALVAGIWLVFGSVKGILGSGFAMLALFFVLSALMVNLLGAWVMSEWMRVRFGRAEADSPRWQREFRESAGTRSPWPFTRGWSGWG